MKPTQRDEERELVELMNGVCNAYPTVESDLGRESVQADFVGKLASAIMEWHERRKKDE